VCDACSYMQCYRFLTGHLVVCDACSYMQCYQFLSGYLAVYDACSYMQCYQFLSGLPGSDADPDPGVGAFLTPGSGIRDGRKSASGSGIRDEQPGSYFLELRYHFFAFLGVKILKFFDEDLGSGTRDPGWRQFGSGMEKSRIWDPG
jgi:hypothetical protein